MANEKQINVSGGTFIEGVKVEQGDFVAGDKIIKNFYRSADYHALQANLEKAQQRVHDYPDNVGFQQELTEITQQIEDFTLDILNLAEALSKIPLNTERLRRAKRYFDEGKFHEARNILDTNPIKGLQAFDFCDFKIFKSLERQDDLDNFSIITSSDFKFGILDAESGCGKTSFLRASLYHQINSDKLHRCVYVKFSNAEPLATVSKALKETLLSPTPENTLPQLIQAVLAQENKRYLVFIFDQFEQFHLHNPFSQQREAFLNQFVSWYQNDSVKLLISIRSDYLATLYEFKKAIQFSPSSLREFQLEKFTPHQATRIFAVIAKENKLAFDKSFVAEICETELAKTENISSHHTFTGSIKDEPVISPIDIQILSKLVKGFKEEKRGFNKESFFKRGGVEGVLKDFLKNSLRSLSSSEQKLIIKILLELIDKERGLRAGVLNFEQLKVALGDVNQEELSKRLEWLESGEVRLITSDNEEGADSKLRKYELIHEKLIKGIQDLAVEFKIEGNDKESLLLERRVYEWLGNNKSSRYLLSPREYWLIKKKQHYNLIAWGKKELDKKALLLATKRFWLSRIKVFFGAVFIAALAVAGWQSWLRFTPQGQIHECKVALQEVNDNKFPTNEGREKAVLAFLGYEKKDVVVGDEKNANIKLTDISQVNLILPIVEKITNDRFKSDVFIALAQASAPLDKLQALEFLKQGKTAAEKITDDSYKANVFQALSQAAAPLDKLQALEFLKQGKTAAEKITNDGYKAYYFKALVQATVSLDKSQAVEFLKQGKITAEKITDEEYKAEVFQALAQAAAPLDKLQALEFLKQGKTAAEKITDDSNKAYLFKDLAQATTPLDKSQAVEFLKQLQTAAEKITDEKYKAEVFQALAQATAPLDKSKALELLKQGKNAAEKITANRYKVYVFQILAQAVALLDKSQSVEFLKQGKTAAEKIIDSDSKAAAFRILAQGAASSQSVEFLKQLQTATEKITDDRYKAQVFQALAQAAVPLNKSLALEFLKQLQTAAEKITYARSKAAVFQALAQAAVPLDKSLTLEFLNQGKIAAEKISDDYYDSKAKFFQDLAQTAASLDKSQALEFLTQLQTAAEKIINERDKADVFTALAKTAATLDKSFAFDMLDKAVALTKNIDIDKRIKTFELAATLNAQEGHYREACQLANQNVGDDGALQILAIVLREYGKKEFAAKKQPVTEP